MNVGAPSRCAHRPRTTKAPSAVPRRVATPSQSLSETDVQLVRLELIRAVDNGALDVGDT